MSAITVSRPEVVNGHTDVICSTSVSHILAVRKTTLLQIDTLIRQLAEISSMTESIGGKLLSGLVLSRWCEYHLMQWRLSRKMTSNRARYLNQDLIVLVRCRKPVIFRVGICVGIGWCCLLLTILNHEVKSHV